MTLAALAQACGGGGPGSGGATLTGTVRGQVFAPKDAVSSAASIQTVVGPASVAVVALTSAGSLCASVSANLEPKSTEYLLLFLGVLTSTDGGSSTIVQPTTAGDFSIYSGVGQPATANLALLLGQTTDASCQDMTALAATGISGTVHLSALGGGGISGTFDAMIAAGVDANGQPTSALEHVTGAFSTSDCPGLGALVSSTRTTQCSP